MKIKILIFLLLWITIIVSTEKSVITKDSDDNDSIIIEATTISPSDSSSRKSRYITYVRSNWLQALGEGNPCLSSSGTLGKCLSLRNCYPYIRDPSSASVSNSWFLGNYDPCSYFSMQGRQHLGICCTNPQKPIKQEDEIDEINNEISIGSDDKKLGGSISQWPPQVPTHSTKGTRAPPLQWPPPIPTHPPNHTAPTHAPFNDHFGTTTTTTSKPWWSTTTPTTKIPWTTTTSRPWWSTTTTTTKPTTTRPWWTTTSTPAWWEPTTTTKRPVPVWPPPIPTHPPPQSTQSPESEESVRPGGSFQNVCGAKNGILDQERIVGGQNASPNEWPWVVVLFNNGRQFCGGSLIDSEHILSAAHCVAQMSSWDVARLTAHLGDHDIRNPNEVRHVTRRIKRVVRHKGFDFSTLHNDVAVLTLDQPVTFSKTISPVCLPSSKSYRGEWATVAGWGSLRENGPQPTVLQKVTLPIWSNADCARKYGGAAPAGITESMLCAGQAAKDSCSGDSGGPLMLNEGGGRWTQVGIVSWGIGCGKGQYPGVYTRVSSFIPWITKNLN